MKNKIVKDERIKIGAKVLLRPHGNAARGGGQVKELEITEVGKKYFYCGDLKVEISTLKSIGFNSWYEAFFSQQELDDVLEAGRLHSQIESYFRGYGRPKLSLEALRTIHGLINESNHDRNH